MSDATGDRPVRVSFLTHTWSAEVEMKEVRERLGRLGPDDEGELLLFQAQPTAAFSRRDTLLAGFGDAERVVSASGFAPVVRPVGGHLAIYDEGSLVLHLLMPHPAPRLHIQERFAVLGEAIAVALQGLGVDARVGPVPGEYCDGKFSVNDAGRAKIAGTGQRIAKPGYLFSAVVMVRSSATITGSLIDAYDRLGLDLDPASVGAVADSAPGATLSDVARCLVAAFGDVLPLREPGGVSARP